MKILYIGKYYYPYCGGIETVTKTLAEGMAARGHQVTVLCHVSSRHEKDGIINGVRVLRFPIYGKTASVNSKIFNFLRKNTQNFDIVHIHSPNPPMEGACLFLSQKPPLVVSYHCDHYESKTIRAIIRPIYSQILRNAKAIVVATKNHIRYSRILSEFKNKCRVIPYGIDQVNFKKTKHLVLIEKKILLRYGKYILFVGQLFEYKGLECLIRAMKNIDANLVILGRGPLQKKLKSMSLHYGLENKIYFLNNVDNPLDLSAFYHASQMLVLPSISNQEAFGLVQLEAMACAKPAVVSSLDSGVSLVQKNGVTGLYCKPRSSKELAIKINSLLENDAKRKRMGKIALKRLKKLYTSNKMIDAYEKLYRKVIDHN